MSVAGLLPGWCSGASLVIWWTGATLVLVWCWTAAGLVLGWCWSLSNTYNCGRGKLWANIGRTILDYMGIIPNMYTTIWE